MSTPAFAWAGSDYKLVEQRQDKEDRDACAWLGKVIQRSQRAQARQRKPKR